MKPLPLILVTSLAVSSVARAGDYRGALAMCQKDARTAVLRIQKGGPAEGAFMFRTVEAYRRERSHVEGEGWSGGAEKGRCRGQQGRAPRRHTGRYNPLGHTPALAAFD
ncbi:hypothetical protein [Archangium lansingense]|uniref:Uncharacterized protein n=1 Tax=Archangium lansingense TaxID=2995310 RepID=A0ABT3ZXF0_9BACT|nr:hypothetical protein [Archangium lansinium]MCY1074073.1 hypothetical protein [Archangium lansinium]